MLFKFNQYFVNERTGQPHSKVRVSVLPAALERDRGDKKRDPGNDASERNFFPLAIVVFVSSGDSRDKGSQNIGSMLLQSNSLGTGMDKLEGDKDVLPRPRQKPSRSVGGIIPIFKVSHQ